MFGLWWVRLGLAGVAVLGVYLLITGYGRSEYKRGRVEVEAEWQNERLLQDTALAKANAHTASVELERERALKEIEDELKPKLVAADAAVAGLSRRLRLATTTTAACATSSGLPGGSTAASVDPAGAVPGGIAEIERDADAAWRAAAADAVNLDACIAAYHAVSATP